MSQRPIPETCFAERNMERAAPGFLFGLAPDGVFRALPITRQAVSSYLTFSPLPRLCRRGGLFSVALSVEMLSHSSRVYLYELRGIAPSGGRTFLPRPVTGRKRSSVRLESELDYPVGFVSQTAKAKSPSRFSRKGLCC